MKKRFLFILVSCFFLLTACSQQEKAEISSQYAIDRTSEISDYFSSYPEASSKISSGLEPVSSVLHHSDETIQIKLLADDIMEFGLTVGRLGGDPSAPSQQTVSTTDTALINEVVEKINGFVYVRDLEMESDHRYMNGIGWEFWIKDRNGQKTTYQYSSNHYVQNGKRYRIKYGFDLLEYLKDKLNAAWW